MDQNKQDNLWDHYQGDDQRHFDLSYPRLDFLAKQCFSSEKVLNIGVGSGYFEKIMVNNNIDVYSLDPSKDTIDRVKKEFSLNERAKIGYSDNIPFNSNFFDKVIMTEVLEHLDNESLDNSLSEIYRILKPNGLLIGTVPFRENLASNIVYCPYCNNSFHRWGHLQSMDRVFMENLFSKYNYNINKLYPRTFPDFHRKGMVSLMRSIFRYVLGRLGDSLVGPSLYFEVSK